jgi:hypothetical protein
VPLLLPLNFLPPGLFDSLSWVDSVGLSSSWSAVDSLLESAESWVLWCWL